DRESEQVSCHGRAHFTHTKRRQLGLARSRDDRPRRPKRRDLAGRADHHHLGTDSARRVRVRHLATGRGARQDDPVRARHARGHGAHSARARLQAGLGAAERKLMERVTGWCGYGAVLCGNSIGQDKRFVDRWLPGLSGYLSYRTVDVTSIKILAKLWYGEAGVFAKPTQGEHDA